MLEAKAGVATAAAGAADENKCVLLVFVMDDAFKFVLTEGGWGAAESLGITGRESELAAQVVLVCSEIYACGYG